MELLISLFVLVGILPLTLLWVYISVRFALLDRYLDWLERVRERGNEARKRKAERKKA